MEAPPIRYAKTVDGVRIAYWVIRDGPTAIVQLPYPWAHLRNEWGVPEIASWHERLSAGRTLIAYDGRGGGMSERPGLPNPERRFGLDLAAVLDAVGVHRAAILATWMHAWTAMGFARKFPDRVSHLVLWGSAVRGADLYGGAVTAAAEMGTADGWQYARLVARSFLGWDAGDVVDRYIEATLGAAPRVPGGAPGANGSRRIDAAQAFDGTELAAEVRAPTLVLHARENTFVSEESAAGLAAAIPGAQLVVLDGESLFLPVEVADQALAAINAFIEETSAPREPVAGTSRAVAGAAPGPPYPDGLSPREVEVLRLVAMGATNAEIAERLVISINTVMRHVSHIFDKTGATNRVEATRYAIEHALTE